MPHPSGLAKPEFLSREWLQGFADLMGRMKEMHREHAETTRRHGLPNDLARGLEKLADQAETTQTMILKVLSEDRAD